MEEHTRKRVRVDDHNASDSVRERLAKRLKREPQINEEVSYESEEDPFDVFPKIESYYQTPSRHMRLPAAVNNRSTVEPVGGIRRNNSVGAPVVNDSNYPLLTSRGKVEQFLIGKQADVEAWILSQPFYEPKLMTAPNTRLNSYHRGRRISTSSEAPPLPKIDLNEVYRLNSTYFSTLMRKTFYFADDGPSEDYLHLFCFYHPFEEVVLPNEDKDEGFKKDINEDLPSVRHVSQYLNIATKYVYMCGGEVLSQRKKTYIDSSPFMDQLERMIEWTLNGIEQEVLEFGRSSVPHNKYERVQQIPSTLSQFYDRMKYNPSTVGKDYPLDEVHGTTIPQSSEDMFNIRHMTKMLNTPSNCCRLKIIAQACILMGDSFRKFAQRSLDFVLAYLRFRPRRFDMFLRLAMDILIVAQLPPNSAVELHYLSIIAYSRRRASETESVQLERWLIKASRPSGDLTDVLDAALFRQTFEIEVYNLFRWAIFNNPRCVRRVLCNIQWLNVSGGVHPKQILLCAYFGYFFGCSALEARPWNAGEENNETDWKELIVQSLCVWARMRNNQHFCEEEEYILERFIVLSSAYLIEPELGSLCFFTSPHFTMLKLSKILESSTFTTNSEHLDSIAKEWPSLWDHSYKFKCLPSPGFCASFNQTRRYINIFVRKTIMSATPNVRSVFTNNGTQVVFGNTLESEANPLREPFEFNQNGPVGSVISQLVAHRDQSNAEMTKLLDKLRGEGALPKTAKVKEEDEEAEEYESDESADEEIN